MFAVKMATTFYQAEEDNNITIRWDSHTKTDMSLTNMACFLLSKPLKLLYEMINGVEVPESQDQQFAGRVQCDKDALRDGRIRLHVSRVRTADSGIYWCDLAANYNKMTRRWVLATTEHFVLNVTSHGENSDVFTPVLTEDAEHTPGGLKKEVTSHDWSKVKMVLGVISCGVVIVACLLVVLAEAQSYLAALIRQCNKDQHQDRCAITEFVIEINTVHCLSSLHPQLLRCEQM
ncbi:uncharacterized protein [Pagrus major]